jgi:GGDEF domain-containing protein
LAALYPDDGATRKELSDIADTAMYAAKLEKKRSNPHCELLGRSGRMVLHDGQSECV